MFIVEEEFISKDYQSADIYYVSCCLIAILNSGGCSEGYKKLQNTVSGFREALLELLVEKWPQGQFAY